MSPGDCDCEFLTRLGADKDVEHDGQIQKGEEGNLFQKRLVGLPVDQLIDDPVPGIPEAVQKVSACGGESTAILINLQGLR